MAVNIQVKVHPVVLFQIADAYERRAVDNHRVIGTLVGELTQDKVVLCYSYLLFVQASTY